jgi:hypothetical protein
MYIENKFIRRQQTQYGLLLTTQMASCSAASLNILQNATATAMPKAEAGTGFGVLVRWILILVICQYGSKCKWRARFCFLD